MCRSRVFHGAAATFIMTTMGTRRFQLSLAGLLGVVACAAINVWLFRVHVFWGIVGLNVTKHVVIAYLCQTVGVDRRVLPDPNPSIAVKPAQVAAP
jgi:hypothetical protein